MKQHSRLHFSNFLSSHRNCIYRHLLLQILLFILSLNAFGTATDIFIFDREHVPFWLSFYGMLNAVCYLNIYVLVPHWFINGHVGKYLSGVAVEVIVFLFFVSISQPEESRSGNFSISLFFILTNTLASCITISLVIIASTTLLLFRYWTMEQQRVRELTVTTRNAELAFLKSQINPHFLFNTLNNANVLLKDRPDEASFILFKLEDLLRYQLSDCRRDDVLLTADIQFINDYLNLEKIRRDRFDYSCQQEGAIADTHVPPLLFIPFVENAVKHNPDSGSIIALSFAMRGKTLTFGCENTKSVNDVKGEVGGLGLTNIRRRLELLYPNRHRLNIDDGKQSYRIRLELDL